MPWLHPSKGQKTASYEAWKSEAVTDNLSHVPIGRPPWNTIRIKDILYVMKLLEHKNIKNTLIYTQLVSFEDNEYICKTARNVEEATKLIEEGFEYICDMEGIKLFRKRK